MEVIKRNGTRAPFDRNKIITAIDKAGEVSEEIKNKIATWIENLGVEELNVEAIQDYVENKLMKSSYKDVAKKYITYRYLHKLARDDYQELMQLVDKKLCAADVQNQNANVDEYSFGGRVGEMSEAIMKKYALNYLVSETTKNNHLNNEVYIHDLGHYALADHNCLSCPLDKLLEKGFETRQTDIRPAKSVSTAMQLVAVLFQIQSLQQFGGVSATHLDWTMVPYVRKSFYKHYITGCQYFDTYELLLEKPEEVSIEDEKYKNCSPKAYKYAMDMTEREIKQACEGLTHNLNSLQSRSGNQLPFSSINYGTCTLSEGRMVTQGLLNASISGTGKLHKTSIFPCGIFQCKKGVNLDKGDPNYDLFQLALKSTSLRLYPNYANCDNSLQRSWVVYDRRRKQEVLDNLTKEEMDKLYDILDTNKELADALMVHCDEKVNTKEKVVLPNREELPLEIMSTMGCRTLSSADINAKDSFERNIKSVLNGGEIVDRILSAAQKDGRGNICPVTIILPTLAMEAKEKFTNEYDDNIADVFMQILEQKIIEAKDSLIERFEWIASQSPKAASFMYENKTMEGYIPEEGIISALKHGTLAIGMLGMAEALQILIGNNQTTEEGLKLAKRICQLYKDKCAEFKERYKLNFGVYYSPKCNIYHLWGLM